MSGAIWLKSDNFGCAEDETCHQEGSLSCARNFETQAGSWVARDSISAFSDKRQQNVLQGTVKCSDSFELLTKTLNLQARLVSGSFNVEPLSIVREMEVRRRTSYLAQCQEIELQSSKATQLQVLYQTNAKGCVFPIKINILKKKTTETTKHEQQQTGQVVVPTCPFLVTCSLGDHFVFLNFFAVRATSLRFAFCL